MAIHISPTYYIRSYEGQDEWVNKKWLAHMNLGNDVYMSFFGSTKKEAEDRARAWYETETARYNRIDKSQVVTAPVDETNKEWSNSWNDKIVDADEKHLKEIKIINNKGHHFAGKVWMVKILADGTKDKKRIDPSEQSSYEANGYVRGGPRS